MTTDSVHSPAIDITNNTDHVEAIHQAFDLAEHEAVDTSAAFTSTVTGNAGSSPGLPGRPRARRGRFRTLCLDRPLLLG